MDLETPTGEKIRGKLNRKVIQISNAMGGQSGSRSFTALCDDGSIWQLIKSAADDKKRGITTDWYLMDTAPIEYADIEK